MLRPRPISKHATSLAAGGINANERTKSASQKGVKIHGQPINHNQKAGFSNVMSRCGNLI
jgi:hypothetical protein